MKVRRIQLARWQFSLRTLLIASSIVAVTLASMRAVGVEQSFVFFVSASCLMIQLGLILLLGISCVRFARVVEDLLR